MKPNGPPKLSSGHHKPTSKLAKPEQKTSGILIFDHSKGQTEYHPTTAQSPSQFDDHLMGRYQATPRAVPIGNASGSKKSVGGKRSSAVEQQSNFFEKQYQYYKVKNEELGNEIKQAVTKEMEECTFGPAISSPREPRGFGTFLQEQRKHSIKREQALNDLRAVKEEKESRMYAKAPQISEKSKALAEKSRTGNPAPYIRLYENIKTNIRCRIENKKIKFETLCPFKPELSENTREILKNSHSNSQSQTERFCNSASKKSMLNASFQSKPIISPNSSSFFEKRIRAYLKETFDKHEGDTLTFQQMIQILEEIGFIKESKSEKERVEDNLSEDMWNLLTEGNDTLTKESLEEYLVSILCSTDHAPSLGRKYSLFKANRLNSAVSEKRLLIRSCDEFTFSPKISTTSAHYAASARKKSVRDPTEGSTTSIKKNLFHFLNTQGIVKCRPQSEVRSRELVELSHCTFRPKIHGVPQTTYDSSNDLARSLSYISGTLSRRESKDESRKQLKFMTDKREVGSEMLRSFELTNAKRSPARTTAKKPGRGEEESIERMRKGREEKERVANILRKGYLCRMEGRKQPRAGDPQRKVYDRIQLKPTQEEVQILKKANNEALCKLCKGKAGIIVQQINYTTKESLKQSAKKKVDTLMTEYRKVKESKEANKPIAFIELNVGNGKKETLTLNEGEGTAAVAGRVAKKYGLDKEARKVLTKVIQEQVDLILSGKKDG